MNFTEINKVVLICLFFLIVFSSATIFESVTNQKVLKGDLISHFEMAKTGITNNYPPIFSLLSKPFAFSPTNYYIFTILLIVFIFPLIFYYFLKDWRVTLFYFATGFVWRMDLFGSLPMALAGLVFFIFLMVKNRKIKFVLLFISPLVHSQLFFLLVVSWLIIESVRFVNLNKLFIFGIFCNYVPTKTESFSPIMNAFGRGISPDSLFNIGGIMRFFAMDFAFPLVILAINGLKEKKELIFVGLFIFVAGFFLYARIEYMLIIVGLIGCTLGIQKLSKFWVNVVYLFCALMISVNVSHWLLESLTLCL